MTLNLGYRCRGCSIIWVTVTVTVVVTFFPPPTGSRSLALAGVNVNLNNYSHTNSPRGSVTGSGSTLLTNNNNNNNNFSSGCSLIQEKFPKDESVKIVTFDEKKYLVVFHRVFDISGPGNGIVPGILYQVKLEIPPGHEFSLEHWGLVEGHVKHRHGRERRRDFIEMLPSDSKTRAGVILCYKNTYGGVNSDPSETKIYLFEWFVPRPTVTPSPSSPAPSSVVFRLRMRRVDGAGTPAPGSSSLSEQSLNFEVKSSCNLRVHVTSKTKLSLHDLWSPQVGENLGLNCTIFLIPKPGFGLETRLTNLSVYGVRGLCKNRFLSFSQQNSNSNSENTNENENSSDSENSNINTNINTQKFCGKIEDFSSDESETVLTFIHSNIPGDPQKHSEFGVLLKISLPGAIELRETFSLVLNTLSPCQKVFLTELSGTLKYDNGNPGSERDSESEDCSIVIHVPYGNTIYMEYQVGGLPRHPHNNNFTDQLDIENTIQSQTRTDECSHSGTTDYLEIHVSEDDEDDPVVTWCILPPKISTDIPSATAATSLLLNSKRVWKSEGNRVKISFELMYFPNFVLSYESIPVPELTGDCGLGQVSIGDSSGSGSSGGGGCVFLVQTEVSWFEAERDCQTHGGHLLTIQNEDVERKIQKIIFQSALFHPTRAYWIGANDRESEGNFQWVSGHPFVYTNWFSGWTQNGNEVVNAQPNDDGLSGQDCVELRQQFSPTIPPWGKIKTTPPSLNSVNMKMKSNTRSKDKGMKDKERVYWNDRNCEVKNFYLCEKVKQPVVDFLCNRTIEIGPSQVSPVTFTSPTYPSSYPDNTLCFIRIQTLPGYQIVVNFEEFFLEDSPSCKYDSLEIREDDTTHTSKNSSVLTLRENGKVKHKRFCGNWNKKLKLLRQVSTSTALTFKFESDFSHHFPGFKAQVYVQKDMKEQCQDQHMHSFGVYCYLFVSFPAVNWKTAQQVCSSLKGNLASVSSSEEWNFITKMLMSRKDYDKKSIYWLGGSIDSSSQLVWADQMPFVFSAFHPSDLQSISEWKCLGMYWHEGGKGLFSWRLSDCAQHSGYICKKNAQVERRQASNRTFSGTGGKLSSPGYPTAHYYNNVEYTSHLIAPEGTQIVLRFTHLNVEPQEECLYDYIEIIDRRTRNTTRYCGSHLDTELTKLDFVSSSNEVDLHFRSDFSETFPGFEVIWRAVDVTSCLSGNTILTGPQNDFSLLHPATIHTPNFPDFNLPGLNCVFTIVAPAGQRIWLHLEIFELGIGEGRDPENCDRNEDHVIIELTDTNDISPIHLARKSILADRNRKQTSERDRSSDRDVIILCGNLTAYPHLTTFISYHEKIRIRVISPEGRTGRGILGKFKAIPANLVQSISIGTQPNVSFPLKSLNYPLDPPVSTNLTFAFTSPANYILSFSVSGSVHPNCHLSLSGSSSASYLQLHDPYAGGPNGTTWIVCQPNGIVRRENKDNGNSGALVAPVMVREQASSNIVVFRTSFNRLDVTQVYLGVTDGGMNRWSGDLVTSLDENFRAKVLAGGDRLLLLNACSPNPCTNGGKCVTDGDKHICRCQPPFTGPFCGLSLCDLNPCLFGECLLEGTSYRCVCQLGYGGERCDRRSKPCDERPCTGHGECIEVNNVTYRCLCHAFWEGPRCEARMQHIPYRPLSERMLREPFWLGIITVAVVLLFITLCWCLKRHFPEKLEKLLNDDFERNRGISWVSGRSPSSFRLAGGALGVREPIPSTSSGQQAVSPQASRSFLGRLGIRKPSLLSISSATSASVTANSPHTYENRTFSLDDLLRPSRSSMMMRTPSPHRRRNFSIHVRRDPSEKQQILQQLVSSGNSQSLDRDNKPSTPKPTIAEIIQMSEKRLRLASASSMQQSASELSPTAPSTGETETSFMNLSSADAEAAAAAQSKAEKKVTFARLMDKLAGTEMSSSSSCSDVSCCGEEKTTEVHLARPPTKKDRKGRFRRSKAYSSRGRNSETDQDAVEMSSSDTTPDPVYTPRFPTRICISPTGLSVSPTGSPSLRLGAAKSMPKMASADSLLALFRRFSGTGGSAPPSPQYSENEESSAGATPLSTPSSPRNSALSLNFRPPPAFHITTPEPTNQVEIPVVDPFSQSNPVWRSGQSSSVMLEVPMRDYCLSPIHEVPTPIGTPMHSPAVTPMMQRPARPPAIRIQGSSDIEDNGENEKNTTTTTATETGFPSPTPSSSSSQHPSNRSIEIPCISISTNESAENSEDEIMEVPFTRRRLSRGPMDNSEVIPDVLVHVPAEVTLESCPYDEDNNTTPSTDDKDNNGLPRSPRVKTKPPPLVFAANILSFFNKDNNDRDRKDENSGNGISVPILNVECATPTATTEISPKYFPLNSLSSEKSMPYPIVRLPDITSHSQKSQSQAQSPHPWENPSFSLAPPTITINQSSEAESDSDTPVVKLLRRPNLAFLSPFACNSERVPSESNLSTSGYSSMASPCPSRCPSVSPLCQMDHEEFHIHGPHCYNSFSRRSSLTPGSSRRSSLTGRRCSLTGTVSSPLVNFGTGSLMSGNNMAMFNESLEDMKSKLQQQQQKQRFPELKSRQCDSFETDSAVEIDVPDIPEEEGGANNNMSDISEEVNQESLLLLQVPRKNLIKSRSFDLNPEGGVGVGSEIRRGRLKGESLDSKLNTYASAKSPLPFELPQKARLSPVSSRSDSPISEIGATPGGNLTGVGLALGLTSPWTDSDGVYDCASSEVVGHDPQDRLTAAKSHHLSPQQELRRSGRRRDRRMSGAGVSRKHVGGGNVNVAAAAALLSRSCPISVRSSPVRSSDGKPGLLHLDLPPAMIRDRRSGNLRSSPKRRVRAQPNLDVTSSSSSESVHSNRSRSNMTSPVTVQLPSGKSSLVGSPTPNSATSSPRLPASSAVSHEELSKASTSKEAEIEYKRHTLPSAGAALPTVTISNTKAKPKISRLRTISLQIRFLRRLEQSLIRKRENMVVKGGEPRDCFLSRSDSTSSSASDSRTDDADALLNQTGSGTESFSSFQDPAEPEHSALLSKSSRKKRPPKILPLQSQSQSATAEASVVLRARKRRLRQYK